MDRRKFLKYTGAAVAAGAAGGGYYLANRFGSFNHPPLADFQYTVSTSKVQANFDYRTTERTLRHINPTTEDEISFLNKSTSDNGPLSYSWSVDDRIVVETKDYCTRLPAGEHRVTLTTEESDRVLQLLNMSTDADAVLPPVLREFLNVSGELRYAWILDGKTVSSDRDCSLRVPAGEHVVRLHVSDGVKEDHTERTVTIPEPPHDSFHRTITIDPAELSEYPERKLRIPIKGLAFIVGIGPWRDNFPYISEDEMVESLTIIRKELGCNAIKIVGDDKDQITKCTMLALEDFDVVLATPRYINATPDEALPKLSEVAKSLPDSEKVVLGVASEMTIDMKGVLNGTTYDERAVELDVTGLSEKQQRKLNDILKLFEREVRKNFRGKVTYIAETRDKVEWNEIGFDIICYDEYFGSRWMNKSSYLNKIRQDRALSPSKPMYVSEFGFATFEGCIDWGGGGWRQAHFNPVVYSQEAQASALDTNLQMLSQANVDGAFLWGFVEKDSSLYRDQESSGVMKFRPDGMMERKKAFYMYKSYVRG